MLTVDWTESGRRNVFIVIICTRTEMFINSLRFNSIGFGFC
jgi:hypothetical protein